MRTTTLALLVVAALAGCSAADPAPVSTSSAAAAPSVPRPDAAHVAAGVAALRAAVPGLVTGRSDRSVGHDVDAVCWDIARGAPESPETIGRRFAVGGVTPSAAQVEAIVRVIRTAACP